MNEFIKLLLVFGYVSFICCFVSLVLNWPKRTIHFFFYLLAIFGITLLTCVLISVYH
jgi:hypothetical protein